MTDYAKLYYVLFNAITDALEMMHQGDCFLAEERLKNAQNETEELYIMDEDRPEKA